PPLVERVEVQDRTGLVVTAVRHPGIASGVVGAGLVEDRQRRAMGRPVYRDSGRGEHSRGDRSLEHSSHITLPAVAFEATPTSDSLHQSSSWLSTFGWMDWIDAG